LDIRENRHSFYPVGKDGVVDERKYRERKKSGGKNKKRGPKDNYNPQSVMSWKNRREMMASGTHAPSGLKVLILL
jgi:hypothetical protein